MTEVVARGGSEGGIVDATCLCQAPPGVLPSACAQGAPPCAPPYSALHPLPFPLPHSWPWHVWQLLVALLPAAGVAVFAAGVRGEREAADAAAAAAAGTSGQVVDAAAGPGPSAAHAEASEPDGPGQVGGLRALEARLTRSRARLMGAGGEADRR